MEINIGKNNFVDMTKVEDEYLTHFKKEFKKHLREISNELGYEMNIGKSKMDCPRCKRKSQVRPGNRICKECENDLFWKKFKEEIRKQSMEKQ